MNILSKVWAPFLIGGVLGAMVGFIPFVEKLSNFFERLNILGYAVYFLLSVAVKDASCVKTSMCWPLVGITVMLWFIVGGLFVTIIFLLWGYYKRKTLGG